MGSYSHVMETGAVESAARGTLDKSSSAILETCYFWAFFLLFFAIYAESGAYGRTPFNASVFLAYSLLHGRFDLMINPGYFEGVQFAGHYYLPYGIGPSLLMLPLVAIWGLDFHQSLFGAAVAAMAASTWWSATKYLGFIGVWRVLLTILFALGSPLWFYGGHHGSVWNLAHVVAVFGLMVAIRETLGRQRGFIIGLGFGLAVLSRQPTLLSFPFFAGMLWSGEDRRAQIVSVIRELWFLAGFYIFAAFDAFYNFARFGNIADSGYERTILLTTPAGAFEYGLFSLKYISRNFPTYFTSFPPRIPNFPWFDTGLGGFSIFISTPATWLAPFANYFERINVLAFLACVSIQSVYLAYYWSGYSQFGNRYTMDYLPFVMILAANGVRRGGRWLLVPATIFGIAVEVWGNLWFRHQGW